MSWTRLPLSCVAVLSVACGNHASKGKGQEAGSAGSAARIAWQFDQFVDAPRNRIAVVKSVDDAALVDATGKASPRVKVGSDRFVALGDGNGVVLATRDIAHVIDGGGKKIAAVPTGGGKGTNGTTSFAIARDKGSAVYSFATGKAIYESDSPAQRVVYHWPDGYVFADASQLWFVDEANGTERWRLPMASLRDAALNVRSTSLFVLHSDRTFEEVDYARGKVLVKGTCAGKPPSENEHKNASECAGYPDVDLTKEDVRTPLRDPSGRGDYYPFANQGKETFVVARDPVGRIRWSTAAPVQLDAFRGPFSGNADADPLAFLTGTGNGTRMLVFDDASGKLLFRRDLDAERLIGLTGPCWLVVSVKHAACIDARTGITTWDAPTSGETVDAWTLANGEALVADANPLALSRIGGDGHRRWQVDVPETHVERGSLWVGNNAWQLSDTLGIVDTKEGLTVIDLSTGKLAKVH